MTVVQLIGVFGVPIDSEVALDDDAEDLALVVEKHYACGCTAKTEYMTEDWHIATHCTDFNELHGTKLNLFGIETEWP
jgi:hypothetical protein